MENEANEKGINPFLRIAIRVDETGHQLSVEGGASKRIVLETIGVLDLTKKQLVDMLSKDLVEDGR
jgi:hypothetical protein